MYIPKIDDYLKILTDEEVKNIVAINLSEYFKSTREKLHSRVSEEQNLRKVAGSLYIFLSASDEVKKYVQIMQSSSSDEYVHHYNVEILNFLSRITTD